MGIVLTHSAKYKPMSFERLIQPYVMATEEYRTLEKGIADLDIEAESMRQYADKEITSQLQANNIEVNEENINKWIKDNPNSFASKYLNYADSLDAKATELATKGLKGVNRKSLYDLQTQYKTNVKPIEDAVETKKTKAAEQTKLVATNPNLRFDKDFSTLSLQELIDNPALGYTSYDLEDYEKRGSLVGSGILNRMSEKVTLDPTEQWYNVTKGVSQNDYSRWLFGDTDITHYEDPQSLKAFQEASRIANQEAMTVPAHLRNEVKMRVFDSIINSIKQTTDRRTNTNFINDAQKTNQKIQLWNAGAMFKDGELVENPDSPVAKNRAAQANNKYSPSIVGGSLAVTNRETGEVTWYKPDGSTGSSTTNKQTEKQLKEALRLGGKDKNGIPLEPILIDKNNSNTKWRTPGYIGQDKVGFKWLDAKRKTRDWGNDYSIEKDSPTKEDFDNNFEEISINDLLLHTDLAEARAKISSFKTDIDFNNYKIYRSKDKNNRDSIILLPLNHPYVDNEISNTKQQPEQRYPGGW